VHEVWNKSVRAGVSEDSSGGLLYEVWSLDHGDGSESVYLCLCIAEAFGRIK